ncbi:TonB-dependent Receptor Plug Domain [Pedobacter insulae]|uniref:TonB-dependent Receptor Plug Domain n=1 Tax=Pedobacter insulae TaxID=414048 RepID=A0A1I2YKX0_9SPHI|nr:TonB-dependent Receptor Plug Domain [Pedobacter insulae]
MFGTKAQTNITVSGKILNTAGKPISSVNVKINETNQFTTTDEIGEFKLKIRSNTSVTIDFTYLGYQKLTKKIETNSTDVNLGNITLKELNLSLEGIEVNAKRNFEASSNSSLFIGRDVIEQIPALSLNDLLNQIPNRKVTAPSLQNVQNLTLRSSFSAVSSGKNIFEMNNAFGVSIIVDGNVITNNLNMQSYNPGIAGSNGAQSVISGNSSGLNGTTGRSYSGDFAFGGMDLRQIPADNIESIEVIAGVPSAKYGDLSEGAVVVERQAGKSPAYIRMQLRDNATSYGFSKGFGLGKKAGNLNVGVNYVNSYADNRDKIKAYKRINVNSMHTNYFGAENRLKNTFSFDYGRNLDGIKDDKDDLTNKIVKFDSWNFSLANRTSYRIDHPFIKNISLNLRYSTGHQVSYTEAFVNDPYVLVSDATTTGIHEGSYEKGIYTAQSLIDGRPLNISARLDFNSEFKIGKVNSFLSYGGSYSYGANNGLGQVLDPNRPRVSTKASNNSLSSNRSERYYDFSLAVAQQDVGVYIENVISPKVFNRILNVRTGLRYDLQNNLPSYSPRANVNYEVSKSFRIGLAYGISYKSPALGQRYPGPTYFEVPIINAYNGKAAESIYLVYVNKYENTAKGLKSANTQTFEFSSQLKIKKYNLSFNAFAKQNRNGIGNSRVDEVIVLPTFSATFQPGTGKQPILTPSGFRAVRTNIFKFSNNLSSNGYGFDLIFTTPEFASIATSFNMSGGLFRSQTKSTDFSYTNFEDSNNNPDYAVTGIYQPSNTTNYSSNGRITSTTHIPKISLFIQATAEFTLLQKTVYKAGSGTPIAYYTRDGRHIVVTASTPNDVNIGHLFKPTAELEVDNIPEIISNFHLSIGKEIKKRFKFSFNVYNVFNYQPYYLNSNLQYVYPNQSPTFGAEISLKL